MISGAGVGADAIWTLTWALLILGTAVFVLVAAIVVVGTVRHRRSNSSPDAADLPLVSPHARDERWIRNGGLILPIVGVTIVFVLTATTMRAFPRTGRGPTIAIDVVAHQWWWSASYVGSNVTTANEIHIPVGKPVELRLRSVDVIHSFWAPELHGKLDALPDRTNRLVVQANTPGEFRGECAEFCGLQHTLMGFVVIAEPAADFEAWLARHGQPAATPVTELARQGRALFVDEGCSRCHTIQGTSIAERPGPDLTHLASRRRIVGDSLDNTAEDLTTWLRDPESIKTGTQMPRVDLTDDELAALVAYLRGLD